MEERVVWQGEDEISLKELIEALLAERMLMALCVLAFVGLSALYSFVLSDPVYESEALLSVSLTEEIETAYGSFSLPLKTLEEYIELVDNPYVVSLSVAALGEGWTPQRYLGAVETEPITETSSFRLVARAEDPETAHQIAQVSVKNYRRLVEVLHRRMVAEHFLHFMSPQMRCACCRTRWIN